MIKIIYLDIDGTLRDEKHCVTEETKKAIRECREKGIFIIICTGRNPGSIQADVKRIDTDGIISGGGCYIEFGGKCIQEEYMKQTVLEEMLEMIRRKNLGASLEAKQEIYMNEKAAEFYRKDFEKKIRGYPQAERAKEENGINYEDNFCRIRRECGKIHKICLIGPEKEIRDAEKKFGTRTQTVQKRRWNGNWYLELLPAGCEKGNAVKIINKKLSISKEESMSFGDGENDIGLFHATGVRVAVRGGSTELIKFADSVCAEPSENGIAEELKKRKVIAGV